MDTIKIQAISALNTFLAAFVLAIGTTLTTGGVQWSSAFWVAILLAAIRVAIKTVISQFVPVRLGGMKKV